MEKKLSAIMKKKIEHATEVVTNYTGESHYLNFLKFMVTKKGHEITSEEQKLVHRYIDQKPKIINKWVKVHPFFNIYYNRVIDGKAMIPFDGEIYIEQILNISTNHIEFWGKIYQNQKASFRYEIHKNYFIDKYIQEPNINFDEQEHDRKPLPHQTPAVNFLLKRKKAILGDDMGLGKCLSINTLTYTPQGLTEISKLKVGDYVIGSDGKKTMVTGVYPQLEKKKMYRVTFNDGYSVKCTDDHLWTVTSNNGSMNNKNREVRPITLSVEQMLDKNLELELPGNVGHNRNKKYKFKTYYKQSNGQNKWQIPIVEPIQFENNNTLPIDPYLLGVSLGDGYFDKNNNIKIELHKDDFDEIFKNQIINERKSNDNKRLNLIKELKEEVKLLGLDGTKSSTKFIPDIYKYASVDDRIAILQGLMDTDGHCMLSKNNNTFNGTEYCTVSKKLADDVAEIVHSLGGIVRMKTKIPTYIYKGEKKVGKKVYRLNIKFSNHINPFRLKRKADRYNQPKKYKVSRYIKDIEYLGLDDSICIKVDADDSLFTVQHGIVTHNTFSSIYAAMVGGFEKILVICPASLKHNWKREIGFLDDSDNVSILNSNKFEHNKWTVVNYDILKNFHRIPEDSKGKKLDRTELHPTPFEMAEFDLIIVDEAHYVKSNKSQRSKLFKDLAQFTDNIWLLTGTPIPNKVENIFNLLALIDSPIGINKDFFIKRYCNGYPKKIGHRYVMTPRGASNLEELRELLEFDMLRRTKKSSGVELPDKLIRAIYLSLEGEYKYRELMEEYENWCLENDGTEVTLSDHLQQLVKVRMMLSKAKVGATIETIESMIDQDKKVIVFSCFSETIREIHKHFGNKSVLVDGKIKGDKRQRAVDLFQNNKKVQVFCGNIIAAGVGLTLTEGTVVIFNDLDWVPANHMQAEDRAYRIGQENDVNVLYMLFEDSLDELMYESLNSKRDSIDIATGDVDEMQFDLATEVIKKISDIKV